jgi:hypothetical protein
VNSGATALEFVEAGSANAASTFVKRDADQRARFADPSNAQDAATKNYVDQVRRSVVVKVIADTASLTTADGLCYFTVPPELNGMDLVAVGSHVYTVSSSGTPTFQIARSRAGGAYNDMLSTRITIDANETDSSTAATAAVIDTSYDDVATADVLRFDCDVAGTGTKGWELRMSFQKP